MKKLALAGLRGLTRVAGARASPAAQICPSRSFQIKRYAGGYLDSERIGSTPKMLGRLGIRSIHFRSAFQRVFSEKTGSPTAALRQKQRLFGGNSHSARDPACGLGGGRMC
jgi:hypothetical protein